MSITSRTTVPAQNAVYEISENMYGFYTSYVEEVQDEILGYSRRRKQMNRFIIDREPEAIAQQLCDQHIIKMVLEEAQMLNTAVRLHAPEFAEEAGLYKIAYKNHPCTQWARETRVNYRFAVRLMKAMNDEYMWRYPKRSDGTVNTGHASMRHFDALVEAEKYIPDQQTL